MKNCYCCSRLPFAQCCEPVLTYAQKANSAEALMRSRYSAFCTQNIPYLLKTSHNDYLLAEHYNPNGPQTHKTISALQSTAQNTQWLGLKILNTTQNTVEFVAFFREKTEENQSTQTSSATNTHMPDQLHEQSTFIYEAGNWLYKDGLIKSPIKLSRNDTCYCGSAKKLKKCCG